MKVYWTLLIYPHSKERLAECSWDADLECSGCSRSWSKWKVSSWGNLDDLHTWMVLVVATAKFMNNFINYLPLSNKIWCSHVTASLLPCYTITVRHKSILQLFIRWEAKVIWPLVRCSCSSVVLRCFSSSCFRMCWFKWKPSCRRVPIQCL